MFRGQKLGFGSSLSTVHFLAATVLVFSAAPAYPADWPGTEASDDLRLGAIAFRLAMTNGDRCAQPDMLTGLMLHDLAGYDAAARPQVMRVYQLGDGFGVLRLIPGSSAERAGIKAGDEIIALNGKPLGDFASELIGQRASADRTERFTDLLESALRKGPATLAVKRGGAVVELSLTGQKGCGGRFVAAAGNELNAWADGHYIAVTTRMMHYAADDQELAFVVAHEMSHNILGHVDPLRAKEVAHGKAAEAEADAMAVELLARAGFDLSAPARFLRRSARSQSLRLHLNHPGNSERIRIVSASIAKLERASWAVPMLATAAGCSFSPLPSNAGGPTAPSTRTAAVACLFDTDDSSVGRADETVTPADDAVTAIDVRTAWLPDDQHAALPRRNAV